MARFRLPPPFRGPTQGAPEIDVTGTTLRECIDAAEVLCPGFRAQLLTPGGEPHRFIRFSLNQTVMQGRVLDRAVAPGDVIEILAAIAGG